MIMFWGSILFRSCCAFFTDSSSDELDQQGEHCVLSDAQNQKIVASLALEEIAQAPTQVPSQKQPSYAMQDEQAYSSKERALKSSYSCWGSFLYWQPKQDYMDVALRSPFVERNVASGFSFTDGVVVALRPGYQPGFNLGAALEFNDTAWVLQGEYTQFNSAASLEKKSPKHGFLFAKWIQPNLIFNNASTWLKAEWDLDMYVLGVELSRSFYAGSRLAFHPFLGVAGAWINQEYSGGMDLRFPEVSLRVNDRSTSFGFGPRMGIAAHWCFYSSFGLMADIAGQMLYTSYDVSTKQSGVNNETLFLNANNHFSEVRPELEMYMGLAYKTDLNRHIDSIRCDIGYDFQVWWNQNMMRWYNDLTYIATPVGNLYLRGLRASLTIGF